MAWWRCFVCGENFPLVHDGELGLYGFYTTRFVEATSAPEAEDKAARAIFADPDLAAPMGAPGADRARVFFEETVAVGTPEQDQGGGSMDQLQPPAQEPPMKNAS